MIKLFLVNLSTTSTDKERIRLIFFEDIWHDWNFLHGSWNMADFGAGKVKKIQTKFGYENRIWFDTFVHWVNKTKLVQRLLLFIKLYKCSLLTFFFRFTSNISYSIYISHILNIQYKVFLIYNTRCFSSSKNNLQKLHRRFSVYTGGLDYMHLPVSINYEWALFLGLLGQICHIFFSKDSFK